MTKEELDRISGEIVDGAMAVHSHFGPGLLESAYVASLAQELHMRGLAVRTQVPVPLIYRGVRIGIGYRLDLLVQDAVVVEVKAISKLLPIHEAQLLSHLRLSKRRLGLLINFNVERLKDGIRRLIHGWGPP